MLLEFTSCKISTVHWLTKRSSEQLAKDSDSVWLCGTFADMVNHLSLWSSHNTDTSPGGSLQLTNHSKLDVGADVVQIIAFNPEQAAACLADGRIVLCSVGDLQLKLAQQWNDVHKEACTGIIWNRFINRLISCGQDGVIGIVDPENCLNVVRMNCTAHNTLECLDELSSNEVVCGTSSGHLKVFDIRKKETSLTLSNSPATITCVKRNPNAPHCVVYANDGGVLGLWDLRTSRQPLQVATHKALVSQLQYLTAEPNVLMSCSYDGQLLRWNISPSLQLNGVEAVMTRDSESPIHSFDVNCCSEIVFSSDDEVLYYGKI